jgi:hypothetical protein
MLTLDCPVDLKQLSLLASLALAARCARRVCHLVHLVDDLPQAARCSLAVEAAVSVTESLAGGREVDLDELAAAENGAMRAVIVVSEILPPCEQAAFAANTAYAAIGAARALVEAAGTGNVADEAERVVAAVGIARESAGSADERVGQAARLDWEILRRSTVKPFPELGEPVETGEDGILGPLFPYETRPYAGRLIEAERALLQSEIEKVRQRCAEIEHFRRQSWLDLESARAEFELLKQEQLRQLQLQREEFERWRLQDEVEKVPRQSERVTGRTAVLRIDPVALSPIVGASPPTAMGLSDAPCERSVQTLRFVLDPGTADGLCLGEILSEIIALGRSSGIEFAMLEGRECGSTGQPCPAGGSAKSQQGLQQNPLELLLTVGRPQACDAQLWGKFEAALRSVVPVRYELVPGLNQNYSSGRRHEFRNTTTLPIELIANESMPPEPLPAESISRQLQKIERLLQRAASEHNVVLELVGHVQTGHGLRDMLQPHQPRSADTPHSPRNGRSISELVAASADFPSNNTR